MDAAHLPENIHKHRYPRDNLGAYDEVNAGINFIEIISRIVIIYFPNWIYRPEWSYRKSREEVIRIISMQIGSMDITENDAIS